MINTTTVKDIIKARGTRFCTVKFKTRLGQTRIVNGMLRPPKEYQKNAGLQPLWNVHDKCFASFYINNVEEIN